MKICMLCYRANPFCGGQGIYLKYVAEAFARQGHQVHAVVGPPFPEHMEGVVVHKIPNNEYYVKKKNARIIYLLVLSMTWHLIKRQINHQNLQDQL